MGHFIYTSSTLVTVKPSVGLTFAVTVNRTENKEKPPEPEHLLIKGYPTSKLLAEKIVLDSNGALLGNGTGTKENSIEMCIK